MQKTHDFWLKIRPKPAKPEGYEGIGGYEGRIHGVHIWTRPAPIPGAVLVGDDFDADELRELASAGVKHVRLTSDQLRQLRESMTPPEGGQRSRTVETDHGEQQKEDPGPRAGTPCRAARGIVFGRGGN